MVRRGRPTPLPDLRAPRRALEDRDRRRRASRAWSRRSALHARHEMTLFEAERPARRSHEHRRRRERRSGTWHIDTGFIVLNDRNYPRFRELLQTGRRAAAADAHGLLGEGRGRGLRVRRHAARGVLPAARTSCAPAFWRMLADLLRFNRALRAIWREPTASEERSLRAVRRATSGYSRWFVERLIVPQVSAVWSADPAAMWSFPVRFLAEFFANHGMLGFRGRPRWQTVVGGSRALRRGAQPRRSREPRPAGRAGRCDHARRRRRRRCALRGEPTRALRRGVIACHADQALALLDGRLGAASARSSVRSPTSATRRCCTPTRAAAASGRCPRRPGTYHLLRAAAALSTVTYYMNHLQRLRRPGGLLRVAEHERSGSIRAR